jgi:hypothetical protein
VIVLPDASGHLIYPSFSSTRLSTSRRQSRGAPVPVILHSTTVSKYLNVIGIGQSCFPRIDENQELVTNTAQRRQLNRRSVNIPDLYPDHPG